MPPTRLPSRGTIWFVKVQSDPPQKTERPVIVVSPDGRNCNPRAETVVVVPMSTSVHKDDIPFHLILEPGETGLNERTIAKAEDITTVRKDSLQEPRQQTRTLGNVVIQELLGMVNLALAYVPPSK